MNKLDRLVAMHNAETVNDGLLPPMPSTATCVRAVAQDGAFTQFPVRKATDLSVLLDCGPWVSVQYGTRTTKGKFKPLTYAC